ncbi:hypothetical protein [Actinoplanes siamensis]|uniref:hypothetical protein n=1 Tax=Actinoplanes siamensis TaxID=1223317 RepID=UPI001942C47C|nr:hypothetical protein [Actinoplanes siamensis]
MHDHIRRFVIAGVLLAGGLTPAGCGARQVPPSPGVVQPSPDLARAAARLGQESARFTVVTGDEKVSGVIDQATGNWEMTGRGYVVRRLGPDVYVKLSAEPAHSGYPGQYAADLGRWVHVAVPAGDAPAFGEDFPWAPARAAATVDLDVDGRFSRVTVRDPAMVVSYSDYGVAVRVTAPPASETIEDHLFTLANLGELF